VSEAWVSAHYLVVQILYTRLSNIPKVNACNKVLLLAAGAAPCGASPARNLNQRCRVSQLCVYTERAHEF